MRSENTGQIAAGHGQVPPDGDGADAKQPRNRLDLQPFELVHDDDGAAARRQRVERAPHELARGGGSFMIAGGA
jgi:hypothetical protein